MEEQEMNISNPNKFVWNGSIIHGFDEEALSRLSQIRAQTSSVLSRKKRKDYSKKKLISLKSHLEFLANQQLLQLDLYSAAMKRDNRTLAIQNIGIAASIEYSESKIATNQADFQDAVETQKKQYENEEKMSKQKYQKKLADLHKIVAEKKKEAADLENEANDLNVKAQKHVDTLNKYNQYNEWKKLKCNLIDLKRNQEELEKSRKKHLFIFPSSKYSESEF